jgi:hypothetical protein
LSGQSLVFDQLIEGPFHFFISSKRESHGAMVSQRYHWVVFWGWAPIRGGAPVLGCGSDDGRRPGRCQESREESEVIGVGAELDQH